MRGRGFDAGEVKREGEPTCVAVCVVGDSDNIAPVHLNKTEDLQCSDIRRDPHCQIE